MKKKQRRELQESSPAIDSSKAASREDDVQAIIQRHLRFGWWSLFVFLSLGMVLEGMHALKIGAYLSTSNSTRRLMWTLAHAHGTLLGLVNLGFAFTLPHLPQWKSSRRQLASKLLRGATLLMPAGFFLGGVVVYEGDPSVGIFLLPIGGLMLFGAAFMASAALRQR